MLCLALREERALFLGDGLEVDAGLGVDAVLALDALRGDAETTLDLCGDDVTVVARFTPFEPRADSGMRGTSSGLTTILPCLPNALGTRASLISLLNCTLYGLFLSALWPFPKSSLSSAFVRSSHSVCSLRMRSAAPCPAGIAHLGDSERLIIPEYPKFGDDAVTTWCCCWNVCVRGDETTPLYGCGVFAAPERFCASARRGTKAGAFDEDEAEVIMK